MHLAPDHASVKGYASDAIKNFRKLEKAELDYSLDSLRHIDALLLDWKRQGAPVSQINKSLFAMGSYAGETLLKLKAGRWQAASEDTDSQRRFLYLRFDDGREWHPIYQVFAMMFAPPEQTAAQTLVASLEAALSAAPSDDTSTPEQAVRKIFALHQVGDYVSEALKRLKANPTQTAQAISGFAAGTLVHCKNGLVPIEQIKVGDWVLSKPEHGGEQAYKQVLATFKHEPQRVIAVQCCYPDDRNKRERIVTTLGYAFWQIDKGWTTADNLPELLDGSKFELADSNQSLIGGVTNIFITETPGVGWSSSSLNDPETEGYKWDYVNNKLIAVNVYALDSIRNNSEPNPYLKLAVHNLELEDHYTYYVGKLGVRVAASI